ncbi:MAG: hypothetical protein ACM3JB_10130 [Acidobacteriaceae bacterium]
MSDLDSVLADLVESDRECGYVTVRREPLEALIEEWLARGDQISLLCRLLARAQKELAVAWTPRVLTQPSPQSLETILHELNSATAQQGTTIAHHRHAIRKELAARLKEVLRFAIADIHQHVTEALLKGQRELAERLESERQTVQIIISTIDAIINRLMAQELAKVGQEGDKNGASSA